jgi:hypothetical protein
LLVAAAALLLDGWARDRAVGAENTAISGFRSQQSFAAGALVEKLAGIRRHRFLALLAAIRARDD